MGVKEQLVEKKNQKTKLTKGMNIADMINAMKPEQHLPKHSMKGEKVFVQLSKPQRQLSNQHAR